MAVVERILQGILEAIPRDEMVQLRFHAEKDMKQEQFDKLKVGDVVVNPEGFEVLVLERSPDGKFFLACNE